MSTEQEKPTISTTVELACLIGNVLSVMGHMLNASEADRLARSIALMYRPATLAGAQAEEIARLRDRVLELKEVEAHATRLHYALQAQLEEAQQPRSVMVTQPNGEPVPAPCCIEGCHYDRYTEAQQRIRELEASLKIAEGDLYSGPTR